MFGGGKKQLVGLDIGSHSVKAMVLDQAKGGLVLKNLGVAQLPPQAIVDGAIQDESVVTATVKNLLKSLKISLKNVSTSISGYSVIIKKINLPRQTPEELAGNIEVEAEQFIPFDIQDVNVDFQILPGMGSGDQMEVILVAAKKEVIEEYSQLLVKSGLKPSVIDVDVFALENAFTYAFPEEQGTVALIDIGANKMNINVVKEGMSLLTKDAPMGGARVTSEIEDKFNVDYNTAEAIKVGGQEAPDPAAVEEIISRAAENWVSESKRTIDYLEATYPGEHLKGVYLSGGSCHIEGLDRYFTKEIGVPTRILNPFEKIGFNQSKFDPAYIDYIGPQAAICLGLALRRGA